MHLDIFLSLHIIDLQTPYIQKEQNRHVGTRLHHGPRQAIRAINSVSKVHALTILTPTHPSQLTPYKNYLTPPNPPSIKTNLHESKEKKDRKKERKIKPAKWPTASPKSPPTSITPKASSPIKSPSSLAPARASVPRLRSCSPMKALRSSLLILMLVCFFLSFFLSFLAYLYIYIISHIHKIYIQNCLYKQKERRQVTKRIYRESHKHSKRHQCREPEPGHCSYGRYSR